MAFEKKAFGLPAFIFLFYFFLKRIELVFAELTEQTFKDCELKFLFDDDIYQLTVALRRNIKSRFAELFCCGNDGKDPLFIVSFMDRSVSCVLPMNYYDKAINVTRILVIMKFWLSWIFRIKLLGPLARKELRVSYRALQLIR